MGRRSALPAVRSAPWTRAQAGRVRPAPALRPRHLCPARRKAAPPARGRFLLDALHNGGPMAPRRRCRQVLGFRERTKQFVVAAAQLSAGGGLQRASNGEDHSRGGGIRPHAGCRHSTRAQRLCMTRPSSATPVARRLPKDRCPPLLCAARRHFPESSSPGPRWRRVPSRAPPPERVTAGGLRS